MATRALILVLAACGSTDAVLDASGDAPVSIDGSVDAPVTRGIRAITAGSEHTCALATTGAVRCWGAGTYGRLGYASTASIGATKTPATAGDLDLGGTAIQISAGGYHTCAVLDSHAVRCWGRGALGALGYGNTASIGDDETPASAGDVDVGGPVAAISASSEHTCALMTSGAVRCWGAGAYGRLGYASTAPIGDDETVASIGDVDVGGPVVQVVTGSFHTCALLATGNVRCWGAGSYGTLGHASTNYLGDDESPASGGDIDLGGAVLEIAAGGEHTCALLASGGVRCWGNGASGQLGYGNRNPIGDTETPASAGDVPLGGPAIHIAAGGAHTCAMLAGGVVRCWGTGEHGMLGYGNTTWIGDTETPAGDVDVGGTAAAIVTGWSHTCAFLTTGVVRCWGGGASGKLGYGNARDIGDDETPASAGDVPVL